MGLTGMKSHKEQLEKKKRGKCLPAVRRSSIKNQTGSDPQKCPEVMSNTENLSRRHPHERLLHGEYEEFTFLSPSLDTFISFEKRKPNLMQTALSEGWIENGVKGRS